MYFLAAPIIHTDLPGAPDGEDQAGFHYCTCARLDRLCSEEDDEDVVWDEDEYEQRSKLFE